MFTLKLIFYGLVAFVPSSRNEGALMLFPNAIELSDARGCALHEHQPRIFKVKADCPAGAAPCLEEIRLAVGSGLYIEPLLSTTSGVNRVEGGIFTSAKGRLSLPTEDEHTEDLGWVPNINELSNQAGQVRPECLVNYRECGLSIALRAWEGEARSCHLAHPTAASLASLAEQNLPGSKVTAPAGSARVIGYRFKDLDQPAAELDRIQAVTDAFAIEIKSSSREFILGLQPFDPAVPGSEIQLTAGADGVATLLLANLPKPEDPAAPVAAHCRPSQGVDRHFDAFYHLASQDPQLYARPLPHATLEQAPFVLSMRCETEVGLLAALLEDEGNKPGGKKTAPPHSVPACATGSFGEANLPSRRSLPGGGKPPDAAARALAPGQPRFQRRSPSGAPASSTRPLPAGQAPGPATSEPPATSAPAQVHPPPQP